jgi:hypothetical protein
MAQCKFDGMLTEWIYRQATQEQTEDSPGYGKGQGSSQEEGEIDDSPIFFPGVCGRWRQIGVAGMGFVFLCAHYAFRIGSSISCIGSKRHWGYG